MEIVTFWIILGKQDSWFENFYKKDTGLLKFLRSILLFFVKLSVKLTQKPRFVAGKNIKIYVVLHKLSCKIYLDKI